LACLRLNFGTADVGSIGGSIEGAVTGVVVAAAAGLNIIGGRRLINSVIVISGREPSDVDGDGANKIGFRGGTAFDTANGAATGASRSAA